MTKRTHERTPITKSIRGALAKELTRLGVRTVEDLRERGWKNVFKALVAANENRCTTVTALSLCAAEMGKRPIAVGESRLDKIAAFVFLEKAALRSERAHISKERAVAEMNDESRSQMRRVQIAAGRQTPIASALRTVLATELAKMGVTTVGELRKRGWKRVFMELVARVPRRRTEATALAIYAAEAGIRPSDVRFIPGATEEVAERVRARHLDVVAAWPSPRPRMQRT